MGESRLVRQGREFEKGQSPAARSRPEASGGASCTEGVARERPHSQPARDRGMELVREGMKPRGGWAGALALPAPPKVWEHLRSNP